MGLNPHPMLPTSPGQKLEMARSVNYPESYEEGEEPFDQDADEIQRLKSMLQASLDFEDEYRPACEKGLAFYDGEQWDAEDEEEVIERGQPPITPARCPRTLSVFCFSTHFISTWRFFCVHLHVYM